MLERQREITPFFFKQSFHPCGAAAEPMTVVPHSLYFEKTKGIRMKPIETELDHLTEQEKNLFKEYTEMSDEELLEIIRKRTQELGRPPNKNEVEGARYFKARFGPWPRMLEVAGVKSISERKVRKMEANRRRHNALRKRSAENRKRRREEREKIEMKEE